MISLVVSTVLLGTALGMRFKVLILAPALSLTLIATLGVGFAGNNSAFAVAVAAVVASCSLQLGYLVGAASQCGPLCDQVAKPALIRTQRLNAQYGGPAETQ